MPQKTTERIPYDPEKFKRALKAKGMSEIKLCAELGYSHSYFDFVKRSGYTLKRSDIKAICYILGVKEEDILPDKPKTQPQPKDFDFANLAKALTDLAACCARLEKQTAALDQKITDISARTQKQIAALQQNLDKQATAFQHDLDDIMGDTRAIRSGVNTAKQQNEKIKTQLSDIQSAMPKSGEAITAAVAKTGETLSADINRLKLDMNDAVYDLEQKLQKPERPAAEPAQPDPPAAETFSPVELNPPPETASQFLIRMLEHGINEQADIYAEAEKTGISQKDLKKAKAELKIAVIPQGYGSKQKHIWVR